MVTEVRPASARRALSVQARDGIDAVAAEEWDALLTPGQGPLSHGYLSAWERVTLRGLRSRPLVVADAATGRPAAAMPGYFYDLDPTCLRRSAPPWPIALARGVWGRLLVLRIYESGGPSALAHPILNRDGLTDGQAADVLLREAVAEAWRGGAQIALVQDFPAGQGPCDIHLADHGFVPVPILPTVVLELSRFASFQAYLDAMRAPYRRRARRALSGSTALHVERRREFEDLVGDLSRLAREVYDRAGETRREILTEDYFRSASAVEELSLLLLRRGDASIASFALLMDDGPCLHFLNCGFKDDAGRTEGAYFRLLYEIVRAGIEDGYARINFGVTTLAPKLDIGGAAVPLVAWMRYRHPLVQRMCAIVARRLMGRAAAVATRRVFRDPSLTALPAAVTAPAAQPTVPPTPAAA